jgi:putative flippase GtrA
VKIHSALFRYLVVGAWNTLVGYGSYALFSVLLSPLMHCGCVLASLLANLAAVTFAFFAYMWFVFKTQGNYLQEWTRCLDVYSGSMLLSAAALPFVVALGRRQTEDIQHAPYIAGAIVLVFSVISSFFGHRHFSFDGSKQAA